MKLLTMIITGFLTTTLWAQNGVKVERLDDYSLSFEVSYKALSFNRQHASRERNTLKVPRSSLIRSGCSLRTPWLRTVGSDMSLAVYPKFEVKWFGTLGPDSGTEEDILEVRIYTKNEDEESLHKRYYMHTGDVDLTWVRVESGGDTYYRGKLSNDFRNVEEAMSSNEFVSFGSTSVDGFGEFRIAICNIQSGTAVDLKSIVVIADFEEE